MPPGRVAVQLFDWKKLLGYFGTFGWPRGHLEVASGPLGALAETSVLVN